MAPDPGTETQREKPKPRAKRRKRHPKKVRPCRPVPPREDCWLCALPNTHPLAVRLWETRKLAGINRYNTAARDEQIEKILNGRLLRREEVKAALGDAVPTVKEVLEHHSSHRAQQPAPTGWPGLRAELPEARQILDSSKHLWDILRFIAHADLASAKQVADLFWPEAKEGRTRLELARRTLRWMADHHLLFSIHLSGIFRVYGEAAEVWALGRAGAELLSIEEGRLASETYSWAGGYDDFAAHKIPHDLAVCDVWLALRRGPTSFRLGQFELETKTVPANYYASKALMLSVIVPSAYTRGMRYGTLISPERAGERARPAYTKANPGKVEPDALAVIGAEFSGEAPPGAPSSFALPTWIERDTGTVRSLEAAEQIVSYLLLARSRAGFERFPQLDLPGEGWPVPELVTDSEDPGAPARVNGGYTIPLLFVTQNHDKKPAGWNRVRLLREQARTMVSERRMTERPGILMTIADEIDAHGLQAGVIDFWAENAAGEDLPEKKPLFASLFQASRPLVDSGVLDAETVLKVAPSAAKWTGGTKQPERARKAITGGRSKEARLQAELDDFQRRMDERAAEGESAPALPGGDR